MMKLAVFLALLAAPVAGQSTSEVLFWKFPGAGIVLKDERIDTWPKELGELPTQEQIDSWRAEYEAAMAPAIKQRAIDATNDEMARLVEVILVRLLAKGVIEKADFPARVWRVINERRAIRGESEL